MSVSETKMQNNASSAIRWLAVAIIAAAVVVSGTIIYLNAKPAGPSGTGNTGGTQGSNTQGTQAVNIANVKTAGEPFVGDPNAPVTVAFWSDYQCPFCKQFDQDSIAQIYNDYVAKGKAKIVFKDYSFLGADSVTAALAARAVWDVAPDKFWQWHQAMFQKQDAENSGWGSKADILALTQSLGIDSNKVSSLMASNQAKYQAEIDADKAEGTSFGIQGTPGTIIGTNLISGAQPYGTVKPMIDALLAGK